MKKRQTNQKGKGKKERKKGTALKTKTHPTAPPPPPLKKKKQKTPISFGVENLRPEMHKNSEKRESPESQK
jgi:hypothetical protein